MIRDLSCYYCEDCYISKIQSCEKLEFIGIHRTVKMVEPPCEKNYERIDSDGDIIENIVEKGMVVAVLIDDPNYDQYLLKLTTGPETIAQTFLIVGVAHLIVVQKLKEDYITTWYKTSHFYSN